jgi:hypothetical protein
MIKNYLVFTVLLLATISPAREHPGFYVKGRHLYDSCGELIILRGVANPHIWYLSQALGWLDEIEKTGANCVRIVWDTTGTAAQLDEAIARCRELNMIPMIECHAATCDLSLLDEVVDYWLRSDIVDVIETHQEYLLLNIANEAGDYATTPGAFREAYETAITRMRTAGIHVPLVIDAPDCGKKINVLQSEGPYLIGVDPDSNLIFSVHMWWNPRTGYSNTEPAIRGEIGESVNMDLPLIVGEFGSWFEWDGTCEPSTQRIVPYKTIIQLCQEYQIGWIAWSWTGNTCSILDITENGSYESLYGWGDTVAVVSPYSIQNTSVRPYYFLHGSCNPNPNRIDEKGFIKYPSDLQLEQNYPNPFNNTTQINYRIDAPARVQMVVYDIEGQKVKTLVERWEFGGKHSLYWNGMNELGGYVSSGIYICQLTVRKGIRLFKKSNKLILLK